MVESITSSILKTKNHEEVPLSHSHQDVYKDNNVLNNAKNSNFTSLWIAIDVEKEQKGHS